MTTTSTSVVDRPESGHTPPAGVRAVAAGLIVPLVLSGILAIFVALAVNARPHDVTIDVVAPPAVVEQMQAAAAGHEGVSLQSVDSRDAAIANIETRSAEGALVVSANGTEVLVASAASPALSQMVTQIAGAGTTTGAPTVTDVVAPPSSDVRASGLAAGTFPYIIAGIALGAAAVLAFAGRQRLILIVVGSAAAGLLFPAVMWWLGVIDAHYLAVAAATMLTVGASAAAVLGLGTLLGTVGVGLGAVTMMLIGNPLSGAASSPLLVPEPWSTIGQWMPPGAGASLVRLVAYFPEASIAGPVTALTIWLVAGLALWGLGAARSRTKEPAVVGA